MQGFLLSMQKSKKAISFYCMLFELFLYTVGVEIVTSRNILLNMIRYDREQLIRFADLHLQKPGASE